MATILPTITRGDTLNGWAFTVSEAGTTPTPIDLTNYTIRIMFRVSNVAPPAITLLMPDPLLTPEEIAAEQCFAENNFTIRL